MSRNAPSQSGQYTRPTARKDDLSITSVGDEIVVYDQLTHNASCLNAITAVVWAACDGEKNINALLDTVRRTGFQDAAEEVIWLALEQLDQAGLLDGTPSLTSHGKSRRQMLRSLGKGALVAIPVVSTIAIQPAAMAGSCVDPASCTLGLQCCSGSCDNVSGTCVPPSPS